MSDWPSGLSLRPISAWPTTRTPDADRKLSPFKAGLRETLDQLDRELYQLAAADRFTTWQANLRAIALGLEALRKVERYGIANRGEQYTGWAQLATGGPDVARGHQIIKQFGSVAAALRATHPDTRQDGYTDEHFADVQAAREATR